MRKPVYFTLLLLLFYASSFAQFADNFSDQDYTENPVWDGDNHKFEVNLEEKLHLNAPAESSQAYLSTQSKAIADAEWKVYVEIRENPSATNYAKIYLVSNHNNLNESLKGYFIKVGGSTDEVSLYRQEGASEIKIIDGADSRVDTKPVKIQIKVTRDISGNWTLLSKPEGVLDYVKEGSIQDNTFTSSSYFGIYCQYTSTRSQAFYFDDFIVTGILQPDEQPPSVHIHKILSENQVTLRFSEELDENIAKDVNRYTIESQHPSSVVLHGSDSVTLHFPFNFTNGEKFSLTLYSLADLAGNIMQDTTLNLLYFLEIPPSFRDITINEILPDPNPQVDSLPSDTNAEFIELYNRSQHPFNVKGWQINGKTLPEIILLPDTYLILCHQEFLNNYQYYGNTVALSNWPSLPNTGSTIYLKDDRGAFIDSLVYGSELIKGGYSIEQINPDQPCNLSVSYAVSTHPNGATPGKINAVYDNSIDTTGPILLAAKAIHQDTLLLEFNEHIDTSSIQITLSPYAPVKEWRVDNSNYALSVALKESISSETNYIVSVSGISDCLGNSSGSQEKSFYFDNIPPTVSTIQWIDTSKVAIYFNEKVDKTTATQILNYQLSPDSWQPINIYNGDDSLSVHILFNKALIPSTDYKLTVSGIKDLYGNVIRDPLLYTFNLENHLDTVMVVDAHQLHIYFTKPPMETSAQDVLHYEVDQEAGLPRAAVVNKDNPNLIHLIFDSPLAENKEHKLTINNLLDKNSNSLSTPVYRFYYDTKAPSIITVIAVDALHLEVWFNEVINDDLTYVQIEINRGIGSPAHTVLQPGNQSILLTLKDSLQNQISYTLKLSGIADASGNRFTNIKEKTFLYDMLPPSVLSCRFISPHQLKVIFDEPVSDTSAVHLSNYSIPGIGYPEKIVVSQLNPKTVFLSYPEPLPEKAELIIDNISDVQGNVVSESIVVKLNNHSLSIGSIHCLSSQKIKITFTKPIVSEALSVRNFLLNQTLHAKEVVRDQEDSASVIASFDLNFNLFEENLLLITSIQDIKGNGFDNLSTNFQYDPFVDKVLISSNSSLEIRFNVPLAPNSTEVAENFEVPGFGHPSAVVQADSYTLTLLFDFNFSAQQPYTLKVLGFPHAEYGFIPESLHRFGIGETPQQFDVLITEVMADPSPPISLPEAQYLELYNPSDKIIELGGLSISDESRTAIIPPTIIMPGEYMIVCTPSHYKLFSSAGEAIPVLNFPSLNAEGDHLTLSTENGKVIFSLDYSNEWYKDAEKKKGGWSLEMIDTTRPCGEIDNWTASESTAGGTPGEKNSVSMSNPDHRGPQMQHAVVVGDNSIQIQFNEKIEPSTISPAYFSISEHLIVQEAQLLNEKEALLILQSDIPSGKAISISASAITDCAGNPIDADHTLTFGKPEEAAPGDLLLSEILFNPRAGGVKFIELYNNSKKYIDLQSWNLVSQDSETIQDKKVITNTHLIIKPKQYLAFTEDSKILQADYPSTRLENTFTIKNLPSIYVSEGTLALRSPTDSIMQLLYYSEDLHHPIVKVKKGVSLERIAWKEPANDPELWQSAASIAGFATPGYQNSQMMLHKIPQGIISVDPKIFAPDQSGFQNYTRIHYQMQESGSVATIQIFDSKGRKVRNLVQNQTLAQEGFVVWDGTDNLQKPVSLGYYIIFVEVYHLQGGVQVFKEKVVVGSRL